jgi:hypothetical protein
MATRSTIALEFADGTVQQIYCHNDGYLSYNGRILKESYSDPFKLRDLIELGSISSLAPTLDGVFAYGRDRGESDTEASRFANLQDYKTNGQWEEYNYILRQVDGQAQWSVNGQTFEGLEAGEADDFDE